MFIFLYLQYYVKYEELLAQEIWILQSDQVYKNVPTISDQVGTSQMNIYISYVNEKCPSCQYVQKCAFQIFLQYVWHVVLNYLIHQLKFEIENICKTCLNQT